MNPFQPSANVLNMSRSPQLGRRGGEPAAHLGGLRPGGGGRGHGAPRRVPRRAGGRARRAALAGQDAHTTGTQPHR